MPRHKTCVDCWA